VPATKIRQIIDLRHWVGWLLAGLKLYDSGDMQYAVLDTAPKKGAAGFPPPP